LLVRFSAILKGLAKMLPVPPFKMLIMTGNYLYTGLQRSVEIIENAANMKKLGAKLSPVPFPDCRSQDFCSVEYWKCIARQWTRTVYHFTGTASMGKVGSPKAVVDPELRVIGVKNLRVIDASVMPAVPTVNTHAASIVGGERGAEFVKEAWK
jgi:choline dehydrogenase